jgi:hypothetical protein
MSAQKREKAVIIRRIKSTKRRRTDLENQLSGGINAPPKLVDYVIPLSGEQQGKICFSVPSSDKCKDDIYYTVILSTTPDGVNYKCTCENKFDNFGVCKHIRVVIIFMAVDLIKKQSQTDDNLDLVAALSNFCFDNEMSTTDKME